jgi:hypothetical protein
MRTGMGARRRASEGLTPAPQRRKVRPERRKCGEQRVKNLMIKCGLAIIVAGLAPTPASALKEIPACVTIVATGKKILMAPLIETGSGLNMLTDSDRYEPEAIYVIVPWSNGAESHIRLADGPPTAEGAPGVDAEGNAWIISTDLESCD